MKHARYTITNNHSNQGVFAYAAFSGASNLTILQLKLAKFENRLKPTGWTLEWIIKPSDIRAAMLTHEYESLDIATVTAVHTSPNVYRDGILISEEYTWSTVATVSIIKNNKYGQFAPTTDEPVGMYKY